MQPGGLLTCVLLMVQCLCSLSAQWHMSLYKHHPCSHEHKLPSVVQDNSYTYVHVGKTKTNQADQFNGFFVFTTFYLQNFCYLSYFNISKFTISPVTKQPNTNLHNSPFNLQDVNKSSALAQRDLQSTVRAFNAHRKWDTQHLEQTRAWPQISHHTHKRSTCQNIQTYRNPFPQPRGPKKSSVGRQTFLHTPFRLGQAQGKEAASFSTTVMMGRF